MKVFSIAAHLSTVRGFRFSGSTTLRLRGATQITIENDGNSSHQVRLAVGTVLLSIARNGDGIAQIDTPSVILRTTRAGEYRVSVATTGVTRAATRRGEAVVVTATERFDLRPGRTLTASGSADNPSITYGPISPDWQTVLGEK